MREKIERKELAVLSAVPLFCGIAEEDVETLLSCLQAKRRIYKEGDFIILAGAPAEQIGVILSGGVQVLREEYSGKRTILSELAAGELFGETFACASGERKTFPVSVYSIAASTILFLDYRKVIRTCSSVCSFHSRLVENMLSVLADKNLFLNQRLALLSKRSTREKLLAYFSEQAAFFGKPAFTIPFSRQELADFLCVERSAMSACIGALRAEGILEADRNRIVWKGLGQEAGWAGKAADGRTKE